MSLQKIVNYKLPEKLNKELKSLIENSFFGAVDEMSDEEFNYIAKKIDNKLLITKDAATSWVAELSLYYSALFKVYHNETEISEEAFNLIGAALFYFINPFDIIPDYTPGIGYLDDLYVLKICVKSLNQSDKNIIGKYFRSYASK